MPELTAIEQRVMDVFYSYKAFARQEYLAKLMLYEWQLALVIDSLITRGYLKANKLGHLSVAKEAQRMRNGGITNAEYMERARRDAAKQRQDDWNAAFVGVRK